MMQYIYQFDENAPRIEFTLSAETTLPEAVMEFEKFLLAAGYNFDGRLAQGGSIDEHEDCACSQDDVRNCPEKLDDDEPIRYN